MNHQVLEHLGVLVCVGAVRVVLSTPARVHGRRFLENSLPRLVRSAFRNAHIAEPCLDSIDKASHQRRELRIVDGEAVDVAKLASKDVHRNADHGIY